MSRNRSTPRSRTWLRVLVLLLALWVPGAHVPAQAVPDPVVAAETAEQDVLDTALRPAARAVHQTDAPERRAPLPDPAPARPAARPGPAAPRAPYTTPLLRTVVLRC
ncbi:MULTISPECIES: hypothetical protein [Streptomyces]|uniref:Secreted protein n=1 Tax=Streptomyces tricolor TaxID=68277 RepID=A0ABS9JC96_9ACTN|nr:MULTISPECIES: hypothetical protein [Streptomyces]MCG0063169.1 hypothetical protein [Streptomyces tricolor]OYP16404.1 hypothetical protein CFC35_19445 [Streptomyces sp. FBKL.4005]BCM68214.1 hypothetical protein EASAB2608_03548 [Streptomyces sp. EAS-AB2608]CUW28950.1 hypothetical protein TUE45_03682 [Streptomyces reticuli]